MTPSPPAHHKLIAKHVMAAWGRTPRIIEMKAAKGTSHTQAIAELADYPEPGLVAFATIGLSDHGGFELTSAAPARFKSFIKAIFDVASFVADGHRKLESGAVFQKVVGRFYTKSDVGHLLVRSEAPEALAVTPLSIAAGTISWLPAWPITSDELVWLEGTGSTALSALLDDAGMAAFDIGRRSLEGVPTFDPWPTTKPKR